MEVLHRCCAGIDVHKSSAVVCVRRVGPGGGNARQEVRTFGTMTDDLLRLADWLAAEGVTHAAMESTGVYWKPVFNLLDGVVAVILVNAQHVKQVPGRKTDVKDCAWLAQLLQHGLLRASFVPPEPVRELRDLTRQRSQLVAERATTANRIQKVLEDANIKLAAVATDILGVSGRAMLRALADGGTDPTALAELARKRLRAKLPQLRRALAGRVTDHHRFLLRMHLAHVEHLDAAIAAFAARIEAALAPFGTARERLATIPGVSVRTAEVILAEVGPDVSPFPSADHLASWAGMCPGHDQSAGKRRSGRTRHGNRWLKAALVQAGWAASRSKDTYLRAMYQRLARRRGRKRAVLAVGHALLRIAYQILKTGTTYRELGADYFDRRQADRLTRNLVRRLESLGHKVTIENANAA